MTRFQRTVLALSTLTLTCLIGCGGSSSPAAVERLPGRWHGEMIVYQESFQDAFPPEALAELTKMQMDFEFRPDGTMAASGVHQGQAYTTEGRWQMVKQEGELLTIKSVEQSGQSKDINIEFEGRDTFYVPLHAAPPGQPEAEVAELGAMRFTRMR